ncbi:MAG: carboxypeptidase-like regulatory domain-containing protein [Planctomycetota bacterium]
MEIALSLIAVGVCLAAGLWLFGGSERRHRKSGPVQEALAEAPRTTATLEAAEIAASEVERRAAAIDDAVPDAQALDDAVPLGSVEGVFLAPRSLVGDPLITLHAHRWFENNGSSERREAPCHVSQPWRMTGLAAGHWRFSAEVTIDERRWSSEWFDVELGEGAERRGVALALVECYVEGFVTDRAGFAVAGAELEIAWKKFILSKKPQPRVDAQQLPRLVEMQEYLESAAFELDELRSTVTLELGDASQRQVWNLHQDEGSPIPPEVMDATLKTIEARIHHSVDSEIEHLVSMQPPNVDAISPERWKTDATGYYRIPLVGPGHFGLRIVDEELIAEDGHVEVDRARPVATHDFEVARASSLRGRVTAAGRAVPESVSCFLRLGDETRNTSLTAEGEFDFERLEPGRYDFYARGGGDAGQDWSHHAKLDIPEGFRATYDAVLEPSFDVEGRLVDPDGQERLLVFARGLDNPALNRQTRVRADGTFTIRGLYSGEYRFGVIKRELTEEHVFVVDEANPPVVHDLELLPQKLASDR